MCYVQADREDVISEASKLVEEFNCLPGRAGYFTETFCIHARFFKPENGERVDAIRNAIAHKGLSDELQAVLLVSLMEAADRVDSTTGLHMAYLKKWAPRAFNRLELRLPEVLARSPHGKGEAHHLDAVQAASELEGDVCYLDPPYNQHSYLNNYHIWETLVRWDKPESYGIAKKRLDCRVRKSQFNTRAGIRSAMDEVIRNVKSRFLVVSFNDEGFLGRSEMESMLGERGHVEVVGIDFKRYVGAQIGIYNPQGKKVGRVGRLRNKEFLYLVGEPAAVSRMNRAIGEDLQLGLAGV